MNDDSRSGQQAVPLFDPRLAYCDSAFVDYAPTGEEFVLSFASGGVVAARFAFHPKHAKRLKLLLDQKLEQYERQFETKLETQLPQ